MREASDLGLRETKQMFPEEVVIKTVLQHKQNEPQLLKQNNLLQE